MDRDGRLLKFKDVMIALGITFVPFMLIVLQPDYGTAIVLLVIMVVTFFVAQIKWIYIIFAAVGAGVGLPLMYFLF